MEWPFKDITNSKYSSAELLIAYCHYLLLLEKYGVRGTKYEVERLRF